MFTGIVTVKIEKDRNFARYCRIIREYDGSLSLSQIKKAIDAGDVVFSFDPARNPLIADGKTGSVLFLETYFIKTLRALEAAGAGMIVTEEPCGHIIKDFGPPAKQTKGPDPEPASASVMEQIDRKWTLPAEYRNYLALHARSRTARIEDEETLERTVITVYGADDLIGSQAGYSYDPVREAPIGDWDPGLLVIADAQADPFCIDTGREDSPVYHADHGMDEWDFYEFSPSVKDFLDLTGAD